MWCCVLCCASPCRDPTYWVHCAVPYCCTAAPYDTYCNASYRIPLHYCIAPTVLYPTISHRTVLPCPAVLYRPTVSRSALLLRHTNYYCCALLFLLRPTALHPRTVSLFSGCTAVSYCAAPCGIPLYWLYCCAPLRCILQYPTLLAVLLCPNVLPCPAVSHSTGSTVVPCCAAVPCCCTAVTCCTAGTRRY